jgi:hypothetical protein
VSLRQAKPGEGGRDVTTTTRKPSVGTLRVRIPSGRAGQQPNNRCQICFYTDTRSDTDNISPRAAGRFESGCASGNSRTGGALLGLVQGAKEGLVIAALEEHSGTVVAALEGVVDEAISDQAGLARHEGSYQPGASLAREKRIDTIYPEGRWVVWE